MTELKRQLGFLDVFAVAAGAMISSGLFVLPAIAYAKAGPAVIISYLFAAILILPSVLSQAELATAMPRAGGTYFYVERSLGPIWGLFSGLANWFALTLKSTFAVLGMALFLDVVLEKLTGARFDAANIKQIAVFCCLVFTALNIISVKQTGRFQIWLVAAILSILGLFVVFGCPSVTAARYSGFLQKGWPAILATSGLVFISFGGLTKVASIAEEVKKPGKNLPMGMLAAWLIVTIFYITVIAVTAGVLEGVELVESVTPISLAASKFMQKAGFALLGLAAAAAFITTANGGILAASRSPMAMSRDRLLPPIMSRVNRQFKTPHISILLTASFMITALVFLDLEILVKTASTLLIILYIFDNTSVIIMRESRIQSYRPMFKAPFYPYIQIFVIIIYTLLIIEMGIVPLLISGSFIALSGAWFVLYVSKRVNRASAVMHIVERVTDRELKTVTLENELRDILLERDNIIEDRFDQLIKKCEILDIKGRISFEKIFRQISHILSGRMDTNEYVLFEKFLHREAEGGTVILPGLAIPHIIVEGEDKFDILLVRAVDGIKFPHAKEPVRTMFVLAGSKDQRNYHLRALMAIAQIAQQKQFEQLWMTARDTQAIRNLILLSTRKRDTA